MAEVRLSRFMAMLLRHDAKARGLTVSPEGYINVSDVLKEARSSGLSFAESDVRNIVKNDNKGRFKLREVHGVLQIKATQGHSFQLSDTDMVPITQASDVKAVLHGTRMTHWSAIKQQGLSRRDRTHIHFAQGEKNVKSGFPPFCDIAIEIDLESALRDGIKFFKSENDVVLSPGNGLGFIPAKHFKQVYNIKTRETIPLM